MATTAKPTLSKEDQELRDLLAVKTPEEIVDFLNMLVYGDAGVGKTYLGGTAASDPRTYPMLIVDVEGGLATVRKMKNIDVTPPIRSMKEIQDLGNNLYKSVKNGKMYYKTLMIDSVTELADLDMRMVMKEAYQRNPDKVHIDVPSPREWGIVRNHIRLIVRHFRDLPCHVIWTAHVGVEQAEGQAPKYYPGFAGKLAREIPGFMDVVGYYSQESDSEGVITRNLQFQGTKRVVAKDRTGALGAVVANPTIPMLWDMIEASQK